MTKFLICSLLLFCGAMLLHAQDNFFTRWQERATSLQSRQPSWSVPLNSPYPMLIQVFRADFTRQIASAGTTTWIYGNTKGLNLIPGFNSEFDVYYPPYIQHNSTAKDGFGDTSFVYKYRFRAEPQGQGNYLLSAQLMGTIPTGSYSNGSTDASVTPTLMGGKGFERFDVISTLGGNLPTGDMAKLGRTIAWNTTGQCHVGRYFWPEIESNATYYFGGKNDGKMQNFLLPGLTAGKIKLHSSDAKSRPGFNLGAGMQIATSHFHSYNHALVFTGRFLF